MKLEEIKVDMEVKVKNECKGLKSFKKREGRVIHIIPDVPYPIEVDFGYKTGVFKPGELDKI